MAREFIRRAEPKYERVFPAEPEGVRIEGYLWARTVTCPYCDGLVPLSPNWRLAPDGTGVRLRPDCAAGPGTPGRICTFRDRRLGQRAVSLHGGPRRRPLSVWRLRPGDRRRRDQGAGPGRTDGRAALRGRLQAPSAGEDSEVGQARPGTSGSAAYRAPRPEDDNDADIPHEARREAVGVGGSRHRAEREDSGTATRRRSRIDTACCSGATCSRRASSCATAR